MLVLMSLFSHYCC